MSFQERLAIIIEANAGKAIAEFKKVGTAAKEAGVSADGGAKGLSRFGVAGQPATNLLKGGIAIAGAAAATAIVKFAVDGVTAFEELTGEIRKFQRVSGASAEDASKLVAAFHVLGVDADTAGRAVFKLAVNIGTGNKAFAESGIAIARAKNGNVDLVGTILNIGDAYKKTSDISKRDTLLSAAFGVRQGQALLPILGKTREEIEAIFKAAEGHGLVFSQEQIDKGKEFSLATRELGEAFKGIEVAVGEQLVPFLTDLAIVITKVIDATHGNIGKGFLALMAVTNAPLAAVAATIHVLIGNERDAAKAAAEVADAIKQQADDYDLLKKTLVTATDAQRSFDAAGRSVEAANRTLTKATADYNKLLKEGAVDEAKVADARRSLDDATRSLGHAQREQTKAQAEYNLAAEAAILGGDTAQKKKQDAADNLADANDSVASATAAAANAAADLKTAQAGDPEFQIKLAAAKQSVADATQGVADAEYNVGKASLANIAAHDAETQALSDKADQAERLLADYVLLIAQHPELIAALGPQIPGLAAAESKPDTGNILSGATVPKPPPLPAVPPSGGGTGSLVGKAVNIVIDVKDAVTDPATLARNLTRQLVWHLGG